MLVGAVNAGTNMDQFDQLPSHRPSYTTQAAQLVLPFPVCYTEGWFGVHGCITLLVGGLWGQSRPRR